MGRRAGYSLSVLAAACLVAGSPGPARAAGVADLLGRPSVQTRRAAESVLLDVARAGKRLVAVGERGIVVLTDDGGRSWRQAKVPTSVSLTAVQLPTPRVGVAVGHSGVILQSEDGGESWVRRLDGNAAARLALAAAQARAAARPNDEAAKRLLADAERLVSDGADKPFLALHFADEVTGFAAGAYGLLFRTGDGGRTWQPWMERIDNPKGLHLYAVKAVGRSVYLAGEQGLFLHSADGGASFARVETPYKGTYFTIATSPSPSGDVVVLGGLRGNAYRSTDQGRTFAPVAAPVPVSFSTAATLRDGTMLFANQAGQLLASRDQGRTLQVLPTARTPPFAGMAELDDGSLMTASIAGALRIPLAGAAPGAKTGEIR